MFKCTPSLNYLNLRLFSTTYLMLMFCYFRAIIDRERASKTYRVSAYYMSRSRNSSFNALKKYPFFLFLFLSLYTETAVGFLSYRYLADTPLRLTPPIVLGSIIYFIAELHPGANRFFTFMSIVLLSTHASLALGLMVSALAPSAPAATGFAQIFTIIFLLLGGFYINIDNVPDGARWIQVVGLWRQQ